LVESTREPPDRRFSVVGAFAFRVSVMHDATSVINPAVRRGRAVRDLMRLSGRRRRDRAANVLNRKNLEAAGVVPVGEREGRSRPPDHAADTTRTKREWWRRRESNPKIVFR
jgi:hypothetical protein